MTKRRKHNKEFKHEAVKLITEEGYTIAKAARSLGLNVNMLGRWKRELEDKPTDAFPGNGQQTGQAEEIRLLREENRRLKMEREILKKAATFFAKEMA